MLTLALKSRVPCLYFSADSDSFTQLTRSIAIEADTTLARAGESVLNDDLTDKMEHVIGEVMIRFDYSASPSLSDIESRMMSYEEVFGLYPELVVIDNITNVRTETSNDDDPFAGLEALLDYLHDLARGTEACVVCLHHVTGPYNNGNIPVPLAGIKGQIARVPEVVLTLFRTFRDGFAADSLHVCPVKNRGGKADPTAGTYVDLEFTGDRMRILDTLRERE